MQQAINYIGSCQVFISFDSSGSLNISSQLQMIILLIMLTLFLFIKDQLSFQGVAPRQSQSYIAPFGVWPQGNIGLILPFSGYGRRAISASYCPFRGMAAGQYRPHTTLFTFCPSPVISMHHYHFRTTVQLLHFLIQKENYLLILLRAHM